MLQVSCPCTWLLTISTLQYGFCLWIDFAALLVGTSCHEVSGALLPPSLGVLSSLRDQPSVNISHANSTVKLPALSLVHAAACLVPPPLEVWTSKSLGCAQTPNVISCDPVALSSPSVLCLSGLVVTSSRNCKSLPSVSFLSPQKIFGSETPHRQNKMGQRYLLMKSYWKSFCCSFLKDSTLKIAT